MKLSFCISSLIAVLAATSAVAADMLPLKHGIYVPSDIACKGAPNSQIVNYWGGKSSIGASQGVCTIRKMAVRGKTYTVTDRCTDIQSGETLGGGQTVLTIQSPTAFTMNGTTYRYCGTKVQF